MSPGFRARALFLKHEWVRGYTLMTPTLLCMICLMCLPLFMLFSYSFWTQNYLDIDKTFTLANYEAFFQKPIYIALMMKSIRMSLFCTFITLLLAYPMAYFIAFKVTKNKLVWLILITVPFWTSYLLRVFAWKVILGFNGVINSGLISMGIIDEPLQFLLYNPTAVVLTLAHAWAAFAILPIYVSLEKIDRSLLEAATDLGDTPTERFWRITWPLSLPGVIAAGLLVFIPTVGDYVTPRLVGGTTGIMIGNIIQSQFGKANNWPMGAALSVISMMLIALLVVTFIVSTTRARAKSS
ncbi:MAG: ABC transporter permease [Rhodospirillales bacterium]|nr:ABC transporter permease [Rhodospirillales bacterium]